ncbi:S24 family peptidase [Pedobacter aquatilis]|uniref:S24 family peptidase n=1 Tax=Pedobacter aquatilis TaxID=351343 RepID=UPI0025B42AD3|nr:S24 family peptidase [Pedobacter aquatilis]MDN3588188.1 S24 family peptidase [Pedobacter aquatilis]
MIRELELPKNDLLETLDNPGRVSGFISPAEDYKQRRLHIAQRIVNDPTNTFYFESDDDQMRYFGIRKGTIIIVDKSIPVSSGMLIVCCVDGEWLTRKLLIKADQTFLCINDGMEACLTITGKNLDVFGAVTWTCLPHSKQKINVRAGRLQ